MEIPAIPRVPNKAGSLLSTANVIRSNDMRPDENFEFTPELCGTGGTKDPCASETKDTTDLSTFDGAKPFWAYERTHCERSSGPDTFADVRDKAVRALDVNTSNILEYQFWTGLVDGVAWGNPHLADTAAYQPNGTVAVGLTTGIWDMIEYFNDTAGGSVGMIHVEQRVIPFLTFYGLIERVGNLLRLPNTDHLYVAGTGYPGTAPNGDSPAAGESWIYMTTPVEVRMTDIFVSPGLESEALDRSDNDIAVAAERLAVTYWDQCVLAGTPVCLEDPGPDCAAGS